MGKMILHAAIASLHVPLCVAVSASAATMSAVQHRATSTCVALRAPRACARSRSTGLDVAMLREESHEEAETRGRHLASCEDERMRAPEHAASTDIIMFLCKRFSSQYLRPTMCFRSPARDGKASLLCHACADWCD